MGIINLTPDSFYAGSRTAAHDFMPKMRQMFQDGADVIDIGACSTRPGAPRPSLEEEWARLEPALSAIAREGETTVSPLPLSIDTYRPEIVRRAYGIIGPFIVNDVAGGEPEMLKTVGELGLPYIAMHGRMPEGDVIADIMAFFKDFAARAEAEGIKEWILDPGFGFGKSIEQNYEILDRLDELKSAGRDILVGISRKSMIYKKLGITPEEAMPETLALERIALEKGASWLRVHDVPETVRMVRDYSTM
ncbi:MAG: dihydropteroate synthase [Bacteroidales bacterium]|nr:dihydropteroate synthase [Bacteroidales bacterium]